MFATSLLRAAPPHGALVGTVLCLALLAITTFLGESRAHAEDELTLRWSPPPDDATCPDQSWAMTRIAAQLGRSPRSDAAHGVRAIVTIEKRAGGGYLLTLQSMLDDTQGSRTLEGAHCREVSEAAVLVLALSVSEAAERDEPSTPPHDAPAAPAEPPPPIPEPDGPKALPAARDAVDFFVRADLLLAVGLWRHPSLGPGLSIALERGMFRAEVEGVWFPPTTMTAKGRRLEVSLGGVRATGCMLFGKKRLHGGGCAGIELGRVRGDNTESSVKDHGMWSAAFLQGRLGVGILSRLAVVLQADLLVGIQVPRFSSVGPAPDTRVTLYESQPVQLRAALGPELRF